MARCPNCTETLHRATDGEYPPQCPKCGVRIRSKTKSTAVGATAPSTPKNEERVVRSFSTRKQSSQAAVQNEQPFASAPIAEETISASVETTLPPSPFDVSAPASDSAPIDPLPDENPFAPPGSVAKPPKAVAVADVNPFGDSNLAAPASKPPRTGLVKGIVAGVLIAAILGVGGWYGKDLFSKPLSKDRPGYQNPGRNYVFYALPSPWKEDPRRTNNAGYDLALHRADLGGWVTLRSELTKDEAVDPKEVVEQAAEKWKDRISDFKVSEHVGKMDLGKQSAVVVEGEGTLQGKPVRGRTLVLVAGGVKYSMGFEGPVDEWDKLERDFAMARENLELTGGSTAPVKTLGENDVATFESKKYPELPYRLSTPAGAWREVPDLQTDSRFDDMKLQDKARLGEVVVTVRETKDLPGMRVKYVERQTKLYENKVRELEGGIEKLTIHGKPAMRTILIVSNAGGDFMLHTTFIQGDGMVFQIQCRAPVDKRDTYEPLFVKISGSFEILPRLADLPAKQAATAEKEKKAETEKPAPDKPAMEKPPESTAPDSKKVGAKAEEPKAKEEKKAADKKPDEGAAAKKPSSSAEKKPDASKKKKSLDDLD